MAGEEFAGGQPGFVSGDGVLLRVDGDDGETEDLRSKLKIRDGGCMEFLCPLRWIWARNWGRVRLSGGVCLSSP